jgi:hypothetical protein
MHVDIPRCTRALKTDVPLFSSNSWLSRPGKAIGRMVTSILTATAESNHAEVEAVQLTNETSEGRY